MVCAAAVNPATSVPSRSKNAPIPGPSGLASTWATDPGRRSCGGAGGHAGSRPRSITSSNPSWSDFSS